jgi:hypothetical protein
VYRQFAGGSSPEKEELRNTLSGSIDEINTFFGELNMNKRLLTLLQLIQTDHTLLSLLDGEDHLLLNTLISDITMEQRNHSLPSELGDFHARQSDLQRQFVMGIARSNPTVRLSWNQMSQVPNKQFYMRYRD